MAIRPIAIWRDKLIRMEEGQALTPIVDNPSLKAMTDAPQRPRKVEGKVQLMDEKGSRQAVGQGSTMKPVPANLKAGGGRPVEDQTGPAEESGAPPASVRLRLRVDRGQVSLVGAHAVPGEPPITQRLDYGLAYEIANGSRRVAFGSVPDVGTRRSFPDPEGRAGMQGHHLAELETFEINVRMPQKEFSERTLPKLRVTLFRMKEQPTAVSISEAPLAQQFGNQLRPVAELRGIDPRGLPDAVRAQVRSAATTRVENNY